MTKTKTGRGISEDDIFVASLYSDVGHFAINTARAHPDLRGTTRIPQELTALYERFVEDVPARFRDKYLAMHFEQLFLAEAGRKNTPETDERLKGKTKKPQSHYMAEVAIPTTGPR